MDNQDVFGRRFSAGGARGAEPREQPARVNAARYRHRRCGPPVRGLDQRSLVRQFPGLRTALRWPRSGGDGRRGRRQRHPGGGRRLHPRHVLEERKRHSADVPGPSLRRGFPPGLEITLSPDADYGTLADGAVGDCAGVCFEGELTGTRPAGHVDVTFVESVQPDAQGQAKRWRVHVGDSFRDVPRSSPFYRYVETLVHHSMTGGCAARAYCPAGPTRASRWRCSCWWGRKGPATSPACGHARVRRHARTPPFCPWVEEVARRGVVGGCGGGNFCPAGRSPASRWPCSCCAPSTRRWTRPPARRPFRGRAGVIALLPLDRGAGAARRGHHVRRQELLPAGAGDARADGRLHRRDLRALAVRALRPRALSSTLPGVTMSRILAVLLAASISAAPDAPLSPIRRSAQRARASGAGRRRPPIFYGPRARPASPSGGGGGDAASDFAPRA